MCSTPLALTRQVVPLHLWAISHWNFADRGSRRFQLMSHAAACASLNVGIKPRTLQLYRLGISLFLFHLDLRVIGTPSSFAELDSVVADCLNHLSQEQEGISRAGWLLSGLKRSTRGCAQQW